MNKPKKVAALQSDIANLVKERIFYSNSNLTAEAISLKIKDKQEEIKKLIAEFSN